MRANGNAAYDFSLFEPKPRVEPEEQKPAPKRPRRPKARTATSASVRPAQALRWTAAGTLCLLALLAVMLCNVQITKLSDEVARAQKKLSSAQADEVRLNMQMQSRVSLDNVENYAVDKLGMQKAGEYQITYIHVTDQDKVVLVKDNENVFARLYDWILAYL